MRVFCECVAGQPDNSEIQSLLQQGLSEHRAGKIHQAELIYRQVLDIDAHQPDALHLLGLVAHQTGNNVQAAELVRRAIARLAPRAAEIFALHYFEDRSNPEIARMLDLSAAGVAVTLHRARTRLQEEIRSLMGEAQ